MSRLEIDLQVPLDRFDLSVSWNTDKGRLGLFGPSGSGKSTLLESIAGLRRGVGRMAFEGRLWLDSRKGICLPPEDRRIGYVPQDSLLFPHRDVLGNLLSGRRRVSGDVKSPAVEKVIGILGLEELLPRSVATLSGGEKRRVALGRAVCSGAQLLLMDEPLSGLETPLRRRILSYLLKVQEEFGIPTLHVSHDATETRVLSDEVAVLEKGRVTARGFPDDVFIQPAVLPLASEESFENLVTGRVLPWGDTDAAAIELEQGLHVLVPAGEISGRREVTVAVSAEDLILAMEPPGSISARNILPGVVTRVHDLRSESQVLVLVDIGKKPTRFVTAVTHHTRRNLGVEPGRRVHLVAKVQSFRIVSSR